MRTIDPNKILNLTIGLCKIPSVSGNTFEENRCAQYLCDRISEITPEYGNTLSCKLVDCEYDDLKRKAVWALLKAAKPTNKTVLLTGHFDVVPVDVCGALKDLAFDPQAYTQAIGKTNLDADSREDLDSGNWLFGRGTMDMKAGLALFVAAIETLSHQADLNLNIAFLAVPDEENNSAGMRGALSFFDQVINEENLDIIAALTGEPCFRTSKNAQGISNRPYYTGTTGKIMPMFYAVGKEAHVNDYFQGLSASQLIAEIIRLTEANPRFMEGQGSSLLSPAACLGMENRRAGYSVTLPSKSVAYFNVLTLYKTPKDILNECVDIAANAARLTLERLNLSRTIYLEKGGQAPEIPNIQLYKITTVKRVAIKRLGGEECFDTALKQFRASQPSGLDEREFSIRETEWLWEKSELKGPAIIIGFLPPYYPARVNLNRNDNEIKLRRILDNVSELGGKLAGDNAISRIDVFGGITDLSYLGFEGNPDDLVALSDNMPGWGRTFWLPVEILSRWSIPVANMGPSGKDAHKATERLELDYSLNIAPKLLLSTLELLSKDE